MEKILHQIANLLRKQNEHMIIGVSGHGGSGKTTFVKNLLTELEGVNVNYINTDPYIVSSHLRKHSSIQYEYNRETHQAKMTACHPDAHHLFALERDLKMVRERMPLYTMDVHYDRSRLITPENNITLVEGMSVAFCHPGLFDILIYFYTDGETELNRRGIRDVTERGMDIGYLRKTHDERRIQYDLFMHPLHKNFDIVVKNSNHGYEVEKNLSR
ncbi:uridine kinase family protein [Bacillus sp. KH172YL63]|uniref:uridine kinase family protein n=1 Tax=Bacillus sp. KH172YL63 TaxID=2709784 RepID=UPI0013E4CE70|nr:NB-ARC domain-containing protein [Bacillus sp. KH172YL63]BCB04213.1 uridine kinase [Bacillus sp. KH172YL63]